MTTDPTGKVFLSYRRARLADIELVAQALHDHGIPTWRDLDDLPSTQTETEIRRVLGDHSTAGAVLWLTPEVHSSDFIRGIEVPELLRRVDADDGFFVLPVVAGGLSRDDAAQILGPQGLNDLTGWNLDLAAGDPISPAEAATVARRALRHRIAALHQRLPAKEPFQLRLHTFPNLSHQQGHALTLDWVGRMDRTPGRNATPAVWQDTLIPALDQVVNQLQTHGHREVVAGGNLTIPAAVALGVAFLEPRAFPLTWLQFTPGHGETPWNLQTSPEPSGFTATPRDGTPTGTDLAVLVSVADKADDAFARYAHAAGIRPRFRGFLDVRAATNPPHTLTPGQAVDVARTIHRGLREARWRYNRQRDFDRVHLFIAVPTGLAVLTGQLLNTFSTVQTYAYINSDPQQPYQPAALLHPAS